MRSKHLKGERAMLPLLDPFTNYSSMPNQLHFEGAFNGAQ